MSTLSVVYNGKNYNNYTNIGLRLSYSNPLKNFVHIQYPNTTNTVFERNKKVQIFITDAKNKNLLIATFVIRQISINIDNKTMFRHSDNAYTEVYANSNTNLLASSNSTQLSFKENTTLKSLLTDMIDSSKIEITVSNSSFGNSRIESSINITPYQDILDFITRLAYSFKCFLTEDNKGNLIFQNNQGIQNNTKIDLLLKSTVSITTQLDLASVYNNFSAEKLETKILNTTTELKGSYANNIEYPIEINRSNSNNYLDFISNTNANKSERTITKTPVMFFLPIGENFVIKGAKVFLEELHLENNWQGSYTTSTFYPTAYGR